MVIPVAFDLAACAAEYEDIDAEMRTRVRASMKEWSVVKRSVNYCMDFFSGDGDKPHDVDALCSWTMFIGLWNRDGSVSDGTRNRELLKS